MTGVQTCALPIYSHLIQLLVKEAMFVVIFSIIVYFMIDKKDRAFFAWFVKSKILRRADV